ncbi:hypothetical protein BP6252_10192 [Coleophoma cylindrospora]|uniref:Uncharacterized protein n=1 Tax=Coleophoma cylindrospora TaxID=1849047 RepID=A0A3D8QXP7_9HELO|nr:hypothetical protein BP6252_10192 [Coleophoma cylindrospora]
MPLGRVDFHLDFSDDLLVTIPHLYLPRKVALAMAPSQPLTELDIALIRTSWNSKTLTILWSVQCAFAVILAIVTCAFLQLGMVCHAIQEFPGTTDPTTVEQCVFKAGGDFFWTMLAAFTAVLAAITVILSWYQRVQFLKGTLLPKWMVVQHSTMTVAWLVVTALAILCFISAIYSQHMTISESIPVRYAVISFLDIFIVIPPAVFLVYSSKVYSKWKQARKHGSLGDAVKYENNIGLVDVVSPKFDPPTRARESLE